VNNPPSPSAMHCVLGIPPACVADCVRSCVAELVVGWPRPVIDRCATLWRGVVHKSCTQEKVETPTKPPRALDDSTMLVPSSSPAFPGPGSPRQDGGGPTPTHGRDPGDATSSIGDADLGFLDDDMDGELFLCSKCEEECPKRHQCTADEKNKLTCKSCIGNYKALKFPCRPRLCQPNICQAFPIAPGSSLSAHVEDRAARVATVRCAPGCCDVFRPRSLRLGMDRSAASAGPPWRPVPLKGSDTG
jgi:hypothetical protein